jgi:serine/threonine protein kinase
VEREIALLRRIDHIHIVKVIGAYQEDISPRFSYFILMHPVGESDLDAFLVTAGSIIRTEPNVPGSNCERYIMYLRTWFLCLASALTYLHEQGILHEDIKPRNIIHRGVDVFFIDFGSSREFDLVNNLTSTESPVLATRLYAAPEAADRIDSEGNISRHGLKTDVFSLGIVFFEMLTVLDLKEVGELRDRVPQGSCYHMITSSFGNWLVAESCVNFYEEYVAPMLKHERKERPRAKEVLEALNNTSWLTLECPCRSS